MFDCMQGNAYIPARYVKILERLINRQKATWIGKQWLRALRTVNASTDMIDQLGGWSLQSVGQGYGDGYPLATQHTCLEQICD